MESDRQGNAVTRLQSAVTVGLLVSGAVVGLGVAGVPVSALATASGLLGWACGTIAIAWYVIALPLAIYRNEAAKLWASLVPLNVGIVLLASGLLSLNTLAPIQLAPAVIAGVLLGVAYWRWALDSRVVLALANVLPFAPALIGTLVPWEMTALSAGTMFVTVAAMASLQQPSGRSVRRATQ